MASLICRFEAHESVWADCFFWLFSPIQLLVFVFVSECFLSSHVLHAVFSRILLDGQSNVCVCVCVCVRVCLLSKDGGNRGKMTPCKIDGMEMLYMCERDRACAHASMYRHKVSHTCTQCCDNLHTYMHMHIRTHTCTQIWRNKYNNKAPWGGRPRREE